MGELPRATVADTLAFVDAIIAAETALVLSVSSSVFENIGNSGRIGGTDGLHGKVDIICWEIRCALGGAFSLVREFTLTSAVNSFMSLYWTRSLLYVGRLLSFAAVQSTIVLQLKG